MSAAKDVAAISSGQLILGSMGGRYAQAQRMGLPEIARAMTSRWISEVPSKIV